MSVTRMQILLTEEQAAELRRLARVRRASISQIVREMVERGLREERGRLLEQQRQALENLRKVRRELAAAGVAPVSGDEVVELIRQMREERTDEIVRNVLGRN
ncbi:MAG TPA: ribbon-helix-helix protein, CopG family [Chloroflexi bacterium]|nr:ribbon-helix-helix protein, CopG family [Chloroflexota bacterium]